MMAMVSVSTHRRGKQWHKHWQQTLTTNIDNTNKRVDEPENLPDDRHHDVAEQNAEDDVVGHKVNHRHHATGSHCQEQNLVPVALPKTGWRVWGGEGERR